MKHSRLIGGLLGLALLLARGDLRAQDLNPRFGLGVNTMVSTADGLGVGFRGRASAPVNADVSIAGDLGFTAFLLNGRRNADYIFDPQLSAIVSLPESATRLTYFLFGFGGYVPVGVDDDEDVTGPTIHAGLGWVRALRESSFFYEINPALIIGETDVGLAVPFRVGIIF